MIFVSSGGFPKKTGFEIYEEFKKIGISSIEFSGGLYDQNFKKNLNKLDHKSQFHNYFPPPKKAFVFNLSSLNNLIANKSIKLIKKNILHTKRIGSKYFSFHAGYLVDPKPNDLGKKFTAKKIINKSTAEEIFLKRFIKINHFAKKHKVKLLIENNVVTKKNLKAYGENPFLLTEPKEILNFFKKLRSLKIDAGLLLDVAHLKVSSKTLGFNLEFGHKMLAKVIKGYHLSDNNSLIDSNSVFTEKSWFWKNLKKNAKFFTIEVYNIKIKNYLKLIKILKKKLKKSEKYK